MLFRFLLLILLLAFGLSGDGEKDGRRGNKLYEEGQYEAAADAYYAGLEAHGERDADAIYYGLHNNLGAALHKQGQYDGAREAFTKALAAAATDADVARTAYNSGNNAFRAQNAEAALAAYQRALLADPTNQDAKFNYEFVKRQMQQQQQQQQGEDNQEQEQNDENQQQNQGDQQEEGEQQEQQQQEQQQQNQNQQQQDQQQTPEEQQQNEQQQQPQPQQPEEQLSRQQAERILQALENEEEQLLREVQKLKGRPRRVEKDW